MGNSVVTEVEEEEEVEEEVCSVDIPFTTLG